MNMTEIHGAVIEKLKSSGLDVREISFKDLIDQTLNLSRPAVNVSINNADFRKVTINTWKVRTNVSLIVIFQHLKGGYEGEARRKEGIYKILDAIIQSLLLQNLGLDLENPLFPMSFRNITTLEYAKIGIQLYQITFWCSMNYERTTDDTDWGDLHSLLAEYYLEPRTYTGMQGVTGPEASDILAMI
jgi:hypothetical protein